MSTKGMMLRDSLSFLKGACTYMEKYLTLPAETGNKKWVRIATCVFIVALMVVLMTVTAFADPSDAIVTGVKTGTKAIYTIITAIVAPIAAIVLSATALKALIGDARDIEAMKKKVFLIVIVVAVIWLAPLIIEQVGGWFSSSNTGSVFG